MEVKSVRLPKKSGGKTRGFAFVEFTTAKEAEKAKDALASTHLYGRHLVFEFAQDDNGDVAALQEKTAKLHQK